MSIPEGYINAKDAARILGLTPTTVSGWALDGKLPAAKKFKDGCRQINIWEMDAILRAKAKLPVKKKEAAPKPPPLTGTDLALLARFQHYADDKGFVSGDATDIILGTPARPKDWDSIEALAKARKLDWWMDNWDRITIQLLHEKSIPENDTENLEAIG